MKLIPKTWDNVTESGSDNDFYTLLFEATEFILNIFLKYCWIYKILIFVLIFVLFVF